jgi:hypothetical protein
MTGRNRMIASAGLWKLGDGLEAVLKLLPPERRNAISRHLEIERSRDSGSRGVRLRASRQREQRRIEKVARPAGGASWEALDPRLRRWTIDRLVVSHGRN